MDRTGAEAQVDLAAPERSCPATDDGGALAPLGARCDNRRIERVRATIDSGARMIAGMNRRAVAVLSTLALALLVAWWLGRAAPDSASDVTAPPRTVAAEAVRSSTQVAARPRHVLSRPPPPRAAPRVDPTVVGDDRTPKSAGAPARDVTAPPESPVRQPLRLVDQAGGEVRDRRGEPNAEARGELERVQAGLDTVREDVEACLGEWSREDAAAGASVMIGFRLDADGLTESWVDGASALPFGVQTCFASAVYGVDWSHVVGRPAEITERFELDTGADGGLR